MPTLRRNRADQLPGIVGTARVDRHTKDLCKRAKPGDVVLIDHVDLDRASAEALVAARVAAVINVSESISGRYPNLGPGVLQAAGIPLVDGMGEDALRRISDGMRIRLDGETIYRGEQVVAEGTEQTAETVAGSLEAAKAGMATQLEAFAANTMEYLRRERDLLLEGSGVPEIATSITGRQVVVVVPGPNDREDIARLRSYIRDYRPVLIGVDAGADVLLAAGYQPDLLIGDMDALSDKALRSGAELVMHAQRDGKARGQERLERLGLEATEFPATGTSEDIAMLLTDSHEASLIVLCGSHTSLVEFVDKGRAGMSSTFLTRLRVGGKLVDAKGVSRLYRSRIHTWQVLLVVMVALLAVLVAVAATPVGEQWVSSAAGGLDQLFGWVQGLFS